MSEKPNIRIFSNFLLKVILPSFLAIFLYVFSIFFIFIPNFEKKIIDEKKEMIRELTETAWCVLEEADKKVKDGEWSVAKAKKQAIEEVRDLRYGKRMKDYYWLTDMHPRMIMHPYLTELNGKDLTEYKGYNNKRLFTEFVDIVKANGSGYAEYLWQWKDDPNKIVPKISYVKEFKPWGWIIGTGVYIDDIQDEIKSMERRLIIISLIITVIITLLLFTVAFQSYLTEKKKLLAEEQLKESHEKYKALVTASTEGLIMILDRDYFYANNAVLKLLDCTMDEFLELDIFDLKTDEIPEDDCRRKYIEALSQGRDVPAQYEVRLKRKNGEFIDVVLVSSKIILSGKEGFVIIVKEIGDHRKIDKTRLVEERENLIVELQTSLLFMNQPVGQFMSELVSCSMNMSIQKVSELISRKKVHAVLLKTDSGEFIGIVTASDIIKRAVAGSIELSKPVYEIMSSPIIAISEKALIFEAAILMKENNIAHLAVKNDMDSIISVVSIKELMQIQRYSSAALIQEINKATTVDEIMSSYKRVPRLVKALIDSGAKSRNVTRILSSISNLILRKLVAFAIDELGTPPAKYTFLTLGSEGRGEETLITDQDNAIVYEDIEESNQQVREYFQKLGTMVCDWLNEVGYRYCKGDIMAKNPKWCCPLREWKDYFANWITNANSEALLEFNIFFDLYPAIGDVELVGNLRNYINDLLKDNKPFFIYFAQNCLLYKPPLTLFGNIDVKTKGEHSNTFNIKEACKPVINFARIYALENNIEETNTLMRLDRLLEKGVLNEESHHDIIEVYDYLTQLRFRHQADVITKGETPDNHVNPAELTNIEKETLKKVFSQIPAFQSRLSFHFKGTV